MRQEVDGYPQGKVIGDSLSKDQNSKIRIAGQIREETGPCPDHIFLILEVRRPPQPYMHRKGSLEVKRGAVSRDGLTRHLSGRIHLG